MIYLITGGAGYIGSCVSQFLIDKGHKVIIIDNLSTGLKKNIPKKSIFFHCNINNHYKLNKIFKRFKIDIVMHFAAFINNEESINNPEKYFINNYHNGKLFLNFVLRIILKK